MTPGGRVLLGEGFWERPPAAAELAAMWPGASAAELTGPAGLVDLAVAAGFRPEWIESASPAEWDDFESGYLADVEEWLIRTIRETRLHPAHARIPTLARVTAECPVGAPSPF